jgi:hypothetical protein
LTIACSLGIFERVLSPFPAALDLYRCNLTAETRNRNRNVEAETRLGAESTLRSTNRARETRAESV